MLLAACTSKEVQPAKSTAPPPLAPLNYKQLEEKQKQSERTVGENGNLLTSSTTIAGIVMPKGLTEQSVSEHKWYFSSEASLEQLQTYFARRLLTGEVRKAGKGTVTYVRAQPLDISKKAYVTVRIGPAPGRHAKGKAQIYINETPMMPVKRPSDAEIRRQIAEKMKYAD